MEPLEFYRERTKRRKIAAKVSEILTGINETDVAGSSVTSSDLPSADLRFNSTCSNICGNDFESNRVVQKCYL